MKQIPFLSLPLPRGERHALLGALRQAGISIPSLCVTRLEVEDVPLEGATAWMTVTGAGWCRHYQSLPGWEQQLVVDLQLSAANAARGAGA